ncbi:MAG TPA: AraC family transcriptional regulator [Burkholderiaceae bacterium]|jgi:AraC-like DNA-binding protein
MSADLDAADPLGPLLHHFNAQAQLFFTGNFCGNVTFGDSAGMAYLHLMRGGRTRLRDATGFSVELSEPVLVFYARPLSHWLDADLEEGADLACASVSFAHKAFNPIALALPERIIRPLSQLPSFAPVLEVLFSEAFTQQPGRQQVLNRLFEVVLIEMLRHALSEGSAAPGFLRGLGHPQIGRAVIAMHAAPERHWTLEDLAAEAGMSRAGFAAGFKELVDATPGDYLMRWRISVAQALLRQDLPLKLIAERVGYDSQAGFLRAFKAVLGESPTAWRKQSLGGAPLVPQPE